MYKRVLAGVDIGGTKTAIVLSEDPPAILHRLEFPTDALNGPGPTVNRICAGLDEALALQGLELQDLRAIGVSCGSPLDPISGVIMAPPNLPTWTNVPIKSILSERFRTACFVENDANAGALAENRFGAGRGTRNMVFLTMGTGLGAGLILNGRLYRGTSFAAGEIGHVRLTRTGPVGFNKAGSAEGWASGGGMALVGRVVAQKAQKRGEETLLASHNGPGSLSARDIWHAAQAGDAIAQQIVRRTGKKLGEVMAILIDLINPECIVVGGLAMRMGAAILGPALEVLEREALPESRKSCRITTAGLGEEIGDVAALCIALGGLDEGN
jgi:glucokinase